MVEGLVQDTSKGQMDLNAPPKMTLHPLTPKGGAFVLKLGSFAKDNRNLRIAVVFFL